MSDKYNGWTNYETWAVALHLGNDAGTQDYWDDEADTFYAVSTNAGNRAERIEEAALQLADQMKEEIDDEEMCPTIAGCSLYTDLLKAALGQVKWYEIAKHYVEDLDLDAIDADMTDDGREDMSDRDPGPVASL